MDERIRRSRKQERDGAKRFGGTVNSRSGAGDICRPVTGFETLYEVSSSGRVISLPGKRGIIRRTDLKPGATGGALVVVLRKDGRSFTKKVHKLVAREFLEPQPADLPEVCHWDGNFRNNDAYNLYYGTHSHNMRDAVRHKTQINARKTRCIRGHELTEANVRIYERPKHQDGYIPIERICILCEQIRRPRNQSKELLHA